MTVVAYGLAGGMLLVLLAFIALIVAGNLRQRADRKALAWAVVDASGAVVAPARFDDARPFAHGLAPVQVDGRWGYADGEGRIVIAPAFAHAQGFDAEGRAQVTIGARRGVIDRTGAFVHPTTLERCGPFEGGVAVAVTVVELRPSTSNLLSAGLLRADGQWQVQPAAPGAPGRWLSARGPAEGVVVARLADDRWGLFDVDGQSLSDERFEELWPPSEGLIPARRGGRWGYADKAGAFWLPPRWSWAEPFLEGFAVVENADGMRLIDRDGAVRVGPLPAIRSMSEGLAAAQQDGRWGFVDGDGRWVVAPTYLEVGDEGFREGRARVARRGRHREREWAWIDHTGEVVGDWHADLTPLSGGRAVARLPR